MIAMSLYLSFTIDEKIELAYNLYDTEDNGYILFLEFQKIIQVE